MGLLSDLFDIDPETEQDIKDVIKTVGIIAVMLGGLGAAGTEIELPFNDDEED